MSGTGKYLLNKEASLNKEVSLESEMPPTAANQAPTD